MQRQLIRLPIIAGTEQRLTRRIQALDARRQELGDLLRSEGIEVEAVAIDRTDSESALLIYTSGPDLQASSAAFAASLHPVDVEFRRLMSECLALDRGRVVEVLLSWP